MFTDMRPTSPESVVSFDEYRPLPPDSPIPQFRSQCCDYYLHFLRNRSASPGSITSDWDHSDLYLGPLFDDDRPDSPEPMMFAGEFKEPFDRITLKYRPLSPESISSLDDFTFPKVLFSESRSSSPESVTFLDEHRPLSADSPIPQYGNQFCDYYLPFPGSWSSPTESLVSDLEYSDYFLEELFSDDRPDSPDSFISQCRDERTAETELPLQFQPQAAPTPQACADVVQGHSGAEHSDAYDMEEKPFSSLSAESLSLENEYTQSFLHYWMSELKPSSPDHVASLEESDEGLNQPRPIIPESALSEQSVSDDKRRTTECRQPYKPLHKTWMSHVYDPYYKGKPLCSKAELFDHAIEKQSEVVCDPPQSVNIEEQQSIACYFESKSGEKTDSSASYTDTATEHHTETIMPPSDIIETGPKTPFPDLADQDFCKASSPDSREPRLDVDQVEAHRVTQFFTELSHVPSEPQHLGFPHAVWLEEAFHEQSQGQLLKRREPEYEKIEHQSKSEIKQTQDLLCENLKRETVREEESKSSLISVSTGSPMRNLSESSQHKSVVLDRSLSLSTEIPSLSYNANNTLPSENQFASPDSHRAPVFDLSTTSPEMTFTKESSSPQEKSEMLSSPKPSRESSPSEPSPVVPDLLSHTSQDSTDDQVPVPSERTSTPPESGSPQLDQLLSDLEEMKLRFSPETLEEIQPPLSDSSGVSPEVDQPYVDFEDLSPEDQCHNRDCEVVSVSLAFHNTEVVARTSLAASAPAHIPTLSQAEPEALRVTPDLIRTSSEPSLVFVTPVQFHDLDPTSSIHTHRAVTSDFTGVVGSIIASEIPESSKQFCATTEPSSESSVNPDVVESVKVDESATNPFPLVYFLESTAKEHQTDIPEQNSDTVNEQYFTVDQTTENMDIHKECEVLCESTALSNDQRHTEEATSTQCIQNQDPDIWETFLETTQTDDLSSQSISDLSPQTPGTVMSARHFNFDELTPYPCPGNLAVPSDEVTPRISTQHSWDSLTSESPASPTPHAKPTAEVANALDEEFSLPPEYAEVSSIPPVYSPKPPTYTDVVHSVAHGTHFDESDPETYFECRQASSDFSETEADDPKRKNRQSVGQNRDLSTHPGGPGRTIPKSTEPLYSAAHAHRCGVLLSSGSEEYEDAPYVHEPPADVCKERQPLQLLDAHTEDFYEARQELPAHRGSAYEVNDECLAREITAELGSMSESSDEEVLTTRVVRRRVIIKADDMPELPLQSVTEEQYTDEHGHMVVKKVTRKIIRKCVSADGVEREEVTLEGTPQDSFSVAEGDSYSRVVKRTVLKSEGDHTEVTFSERGGISASGEEPVWACKVTRVERTVVVEGERTVKHLGDPSLAYDLPSAQDDFKQALGYVGDFSKAELPQVVEKEIVKEDGTVIRRARMRKGRTHRRTVVKGTGGRRQILLECVDDPEERSQPCDLKDDLHRLIHRYCEEEKDGEKEEEE